MVGVAFDQRSTSRPQNHLLREVLATAQAFDFERVSREVLAGLDVGREDSVLELGCGSGRTLLRVAVRAHRGFVAGVDPCELQIRHALLRTRPFVKKGRVQLARGGSADLSLFPAGRFDKVYGVHVVPFWRAATDDLREVRRVLRADGCLLLGYAPVALVTGAGRRACARPQDVEAWLTSSGFHAIETRVSKVDDRPLAWTRAAA
jgi:SAM-dependent methyltransferase